MRKRRYQGDASWKEADSGFTDTSSSNTKAEASHSFLKKHGKVVLGILIALLVLIYGIGVYYYKDHFPHNTFVNETRIGGMTVKEAEDTFTKDLASHKIAIKEKERTEIIDPAEVNTIISVGTQISDLHESMNPWTWFTGIFGKNKQTIHLDVTFDADALKETVNNLECFKKGNVQAPVNTYIKRGDTEFSIVPEVLGNTVKKKALLARINEALATCVTNIDLEKEDLYKLPEYYADDAVVKDALKKANEYSHGSVTYDFKYTKESIDYNTISQWISISDNFKVSVNPDKVGDYVEELGGKYNTMGSSRNFKTSNGNTINAYGGDYGWKIWFDKEKEQLIKDIESGKDVSREPIYSYTAMCRNSAKDDIGDSYVEVSIASQEVWLYVDGECKLDTSCVTGNPTLKHDTYTGIYSLTYKQRNATLTGPNSNGTSYSSDVSFWMPFNGNQGLHDATWRDSFGGSIYKTNGSHGCINLPYSAAATLYKYVDAGFPIVIY